jgi:hypothetical protein
MSSDPYNNILDEHGAVRRNLVDDLLIEIISGRSVFVSGGEMYAVRNPTMDEQDAARMVYARRMHECRKAGIPCREDLEKIALEMGYFDQAERDETRAIEQMIDRSIKAREKTHDPRQKVTLAASIETLRSKFVEIKMREEEVFLHSAESRADDVRVDFLLSRCTLTGELLDMSAWKSWEEFLTSTNLRLIADARKAFVRVSNGLPIKIIRAVARTSEWKTRWRGAREAGVPVFSQPAGDWDANKRNLAWWSDFYDSIAKHPESPDEATVNNDEALQDWLNNQVALRDKAQRQQPNANRQRKPVTYIDGHGVRRQMTQTGSETINVNTPYAIKV